MRHVQQMLVLDRVGQPIAREPRLPRAERVAAAAQPKILIGDEEAVVGVAQQGQAAAGRRRSPSPRAAAGRSWRRHRGRPVRATGGAAPDRSVRRARSPSRWRSGTSTPTSTTVVATSSRMRRRQTRRARRRGPPASAGRAPGRPVAEPLAQIDEPLLGGGDVQRLALGDQRADPVDLRAFVQLARDPLQHRRHACRASAAWCGSAGGPAGFSVRRLTSISPHCVSSSVRGIGVAVITRTSVCSPLRAEQQALVDAEAVLLVDHRQGEVAILDGVLEQRVGADDNLDRAILDAAQQAARAPCP